MKRETIKNNVSLTFLPNEKFKRNRISILVVDVVPKSLEFLFVEVVVQRIVLDLRIMSIGDHILQNTFIEDCLH